MSEHTNKGRGFSLTNFCWLFFVLCVSCAAPQAEQMTPVRFKQIVDMPGDAKPLSHALAGLPHWTNAVVHIVMTYASGQVYREDSEATAHTVGGKYVVWALTSQYYGQTMYGISANDVKGKAIKIYSLYGNDQGGNRVIEATAVYNPHTRTYSIRSAYDDFEEETTGRYTDSEDVSKTLVYKAGALFMTREVELRRK